MTLALLPILTVAALLLVLAGVIKLVSPDRARASIALAGGPVPRAVVRLIGAAEVTLGLFAAVRPGAVSALAMAAAYAAFALFVARLLRVTGGGAECGCFGGSGADASVGHVAFNLVACACCLLAAAAPPPGLDWVLGTSPAVAIPWILGTVAAAYAAFIAFTVLPRAWATYGSGGLS